MFWGPKSDQEVTNNEYLFLIIFRRQKNYRASCDFGICVEVTGRHFI